jgi:hypothetical protein
VIDAQSRATEYASAPRRTALWIGGGFGATVAVAGLILAAKGTGESGVKFAALMSARVAFLFFWPAYAGGAAARLFGPALSGLARHGREFGLAFAAALSVHLALVLWLFLISAHPPVGPAVIVTFGLGALWLYALAAASLIPVGQVPSPKALRIFRTAGLEYIALLFVYDFVLSPLRNGFSHPLEYLPFSLMIVVGVILRLVAWLRRRFAPAAATAIGSR